MLTQEPQNSVNEENQNRSRWERGQQPKLQVRRATAANVDKKSPVLRRHTSPNVGMTSIPAEFDDIIQALESDSHQRQAGVGNGRLTTRLNRNHAHSLDRELTEISYGGITEDNIMSLLPADVLDRQWVDITDTVV